MRKHFLFCLLGFYFVLGLADLPKLNLSDNEESKLIMDMRSVKSSDSNMICKNRSGLSLFTSSPYPNDANGFDKHSVHWDTETRYGYDKNGFNAAEWNAEGINKETGTLYDVNGYDIHGYDANGYDVDLRRAWYPEGWVPNFNAMPGKTLVTTRTSGNTFYDENGNLYVNDIYNKQINIYNTAGDLIRTISLNKLYQIFPGYTGWVYGIAYDPKIKIIYCSLSNGNNLRAIDKDGNIVHIEWTWTGSVSFGMQFIEDSIYVINTYINNFRGERIPSNRKLFSKVTVHKRSNPAIITATISAPSQMPYDYVLTGFTIDNNGYQYFLGYKNGNPSRGSSALYITDKNGNFLKSISLSIPYASGLNIDPSGRLIIGTNSNSDYKLYFLDPIF